MLPRRVGHPVLSPGDHGKSPILSPDQTALATRASGPTVNSRAGPEVVGKPPHSPEKHMTHLYRPIKGYSTPVVRVTTPEGRPLFTLSFTTAGDDINPPPTSTQAMRDEAWAAWQQAEQNGFQNNS